MSVMLTMEGALIYVITQLEVLIVTVEKALSYKMIDLPVEVRVIVRNDYTCKSISEITVVTLFRDELVFFWILGVFKGLKNL